MANTGRMLTGTNPRLLQYGLDKIIDHFDNLAPVVVDQLFQKEDADKGFYEFVQLAGMSMAARRGESDVLTYDSINQDFNPRYTIYTYEKGARISMEAMEDNVYKNMVKLIGQCFSQSHSDNRDYQGAGILNGATTLTWGDGVALLSTSHPIQAGGTWSNRLSPDANLSYDSVQQASILIDQIRNPNGMIGNYKSQRLVVPSDLKFEATKIWKSEADPTTADRSTNTVLGAGALTGPAYVWKRLSSATTWFLTSSAPNGLIMASRKGMTTRMVEDIYTYDHIYTSFQRFRTLVGDSRCIAGSVGV